MKIIVETRDYNVSTAKENEEVGVAETGMKISLEDIDVGMRRHLPESVTGILMNAFMKAAENFVEEHECKDCVPYVTYNSMLRHLEVIQKESLKSIGEEKRLENL